MAKHKYFKQNKNSKDNNNEFFENLFANSIHRLKSVSGVFTFQITKFY